MRDLSYFPDARTTFPWLVLAAWAAVGLALAMIGHFRAGVKVEVENELAAPTAAAANESELVASR